MKVKNYVCTRCSFNFRYTRMVEFCPNCGTKGFMLLQKGFKMDKKKALSLIRICKYEFDCDNSGYHDELAIKLEELEKWIDYNTK